VFTRNQGYIKPAFKHKSILKLFYRKYPKLIETLLNRHEIYNRQLALCEQLEHEGKAIIIRPLLPLAVDRAAADSKKLLALYDEGHDEGKQAIKLIKDMGERFNGLDFRIEYGVEK
jgi:predicted patatin/cPLA2 family phospholipase